MSGSLLLTLCFVPLRQGLSLDLEPSQHRQVPEISLPGITIVCAARSRLLCDVWGLELSPFCMSSR